MNKKVLTVLEFNKIRDMLVNYVTSDPGRQLAENLEPVSDREEITRNQQITEDALNRIIKSGKISFGSNRNLKELTKAAALGVCLSIRELLTVASFMDNVANVKKYDKSYGEENNKEDTLTEKFALLYEDRPLSEEIHRCLPSEDFVADTASRALHTIRRGISQTGEKIQTELNSMITGRYRTYLQEMVITTRGGRYCIPVKVEYKGQVPGMIHDQSGTGSTVFIEPQAVVDLNNKIRELEIKEQQEIEKILMDLTGKVALISEAINTNQLIMTELDFAFAKGGMALAMKATRPQFNDKGIINLRKARHPLLPEDKVVPIDVRLGEDFDLLVVTGPNTGGKTVSLKTVGLLTLMGQAGLHIPALDRSRLAIFNKVYADIGDEQSIEQSLSTFSSHMKNIVAILKNADRSCLCLFDELGAGTDPTEGAALAIAILDYLHTKGIRAMATTHYSELKIYALKTHGVENACQEFNVDTLSPTYRLLIGVPGKSNAFAISKRLGLSQTIIDAAAEQITEEKESFEDVITQLEESRNKIEEDKRSIEEYKKRIKLHEEALAKKQEKLDNAREKILQEARQEAKGILSSAKEVADETIRVFQKAGPDATIRDLEKAREKIRGKAKEVEETGVREIPKPQKELQKDSLKLGDTVKVLSLGMTGTVTKLPDDKGDCIVTCGIMNTKVNIKNLVLTVPVKEEKLSKGRSSIGKLKMSKSLGVSTEINLLGKTRDEAVFELDKYLDDAYLAHLPSVRIVHGKGTGALRQAVHSHLRKVKYVKSFRPGEFGEGDAGVTICEFKD